MPDIQPADFQKLLSTSFKTWFHDNFFSTEHNTTATTQTGNVGQDLASLLVETGVQSASTARFNYDRSAFNPRYGTLHFKLNMNSMKDVFLFAGFKESLAAPAFAMTESHSGIILYNNVMYYSVGNGDALNPRQATVPITDADMTRWLVYRVNNNRFQYYSLPYTVPYFEENIPDKLREGFIRKWSPLYSTGSLMPKNSTHYLVFYISNSTGLDKTAELQFIDYGEFYAD